MPLSIVSLLEALSMTNAITYDCDQDVVSKKEMSFIYLIRDPVRCHGVPNYLCHVLATVISNYLLEIDQKFFYKANQ